MGVFLKNKSWYVDYRLPGGQRKREVVGKIPSVTQRDAEKVLRIRQAEIFQGRYNIESTKKPIPFDKFVNEEYLPWAKDHYEDFDRVRSACEHFLGYFKKRNLSDFDNWIVDKYKSKRKHSVKKSAKSPVKKTGIKPETINRELTVLHRIFTLAVEWKRISTNPIQGMKKEKVTPKGKQKLKVWAFELLYDCAEVHLKPILLCGYDTGMRKDEVRKLKWKHVDLEDRYIHVIETKNNESRSIPISDKLYDTLIAIRKFNKTEFVFLDEKGKPYKSKKAWEGSFKKALQLSGIEYCTFHDLRHTFISDLIVKYKEDHTTVMDLSGHKDMRMLKVYSHTDESAKKEAIKKIGKRFEEMTGLKKKDSKEVQLRSI